MRVGDMRPPLRDRTVESLGRGGLMVAVPAYFEIRNWGPLAHGRGRGAKELAARGAGPAAPPAGGGDQQTPGGLGSHQRLWLEGDWCRWVDISCQSDDMRNDFGTFPPGQPLCKPRYN
jgi:hypothetical protein